MSLRIPLVLAAVAVSALGLASGGGAGTADVRLVATVRPCTVVVRGTQSQTLRAGTYPVTVIDSSRTRYFKLRGPGIIKATTAPFSGTAHWRLNLRKGSYRFSCGATRRLRGVLTVTG